VTAATPSAASTAPPLLAASKLSRRFGGLLAVSDVDLELRPGRLLGVIGANGAGKSTLINMLTGHLQPTSGRVLIDGHDQTGAKPWTIAHAGVARTFQIVKPFREMTVVENVMLGELFGKGSARPAVARKAALELMERVGLGGKAELNPAELSVADARRLELARALALRPRVLLLDEVLAGLRPNEIQPAVELIDGLRKEGLALLMVEHVVHAIAAISDEILVLHHGQMLTRGPAAEVLSDDRVIAAYLGSRYAARQKARAAAASSAPKPGGST
jgi:branched-chain amino acid transport system ATP-binding protein